VSIKHDSLLRRPDVSRLLKHLSENKTTNIDPVIDSTGIHYPTVESILETDVSDANNVLESLSDLGFLEKQILESILACSSCGFPYLSIRLVCPTCGSGRIIKGSVIEHLICGYVDFEQFFYENGYSCPKCQKKLNALGVDYRKSGYFFKCMSCGRITPLPVKRYICCKCLKANTEEELDTKQIHRYAVNLDKISSHTAELADISPLTGYFESKGYVVKQHVEVQGSSGVVHDFLLFIGNSEDFASGVVIDIVNKLDENKVFEFFVKSFDVKVGGSFLFLLGDVDEKTLKIAQTFNIMVFKASSLAELIEKVREPIMIALTLLKKRETTKEISELEELIKRLE